jgi:hypothetical protein
MYRFAWSFRARNDASLSDFLNFRGKSPKLGGRSVDNEKLLH